MPHSSDDRNPVERLAEEFLDRHRRGEHPPLTEYVNRHPEWAEEIRELFPALVMMERIKPAAGDATGSFIGNGRAKHGRVPERLGDFRILREVGRGGMGIVFEAVQESLGRHVALKVLPSHALLNPRHLQRFLREARSAARLHHTNIVPVFGVGEGDGLHYYVMQFIAGSGLHEVIEELRRLKPSNRPGGAPAALMPATPALLEITRGLLTGRFVLLSDPPQVTTDAETPNGVPGSGPRLPIVPVVPSGSSILSVSGRGFAKEVARVGLQVAEALKYAHGQGVFHRDIKPSNLLLDVQGTVWVTDFGLAKAMTDSDNLTNEGDVLGTLRYMAPERFRGHSDARSDVYALGLTLYELLTLRPAFDQEDRDRLLHQVTTSVPARPRTINREIPRDLETIVLKAIEHDAARRYQDADDLARDLERFLADRPILARPVGALERAWKWALRKPAIAGLLTALAVAVVVGFAGITWQWRAAVEASRISLLNADQAHRNFDHAMRTVDTFCTQVSQEHLLDQPGMLGLRRRLLDLALDYYLSFQRQQDQAPWKCAGDDSQLNQAMALSFMHSGIIKNEIGEPAEANRALLRAKDLLDELLRARPQDLKIQEQLALCFLEIEDVERLNDFEFRRDADIKVNHSVPLSESLAAAYPENPEYLRRLGRSYDLDGLRLLRWRPDSRSEPEADFHRAIATLELACRIAPDNVDGVRRLGLAQAHLGLVFLLAGQHANCVETLGKALATLEPLEKRFPKSRRFRLDRAECFVNVAIADIDPGHYPEAEVALVEAENRLVQLDQEDQRTVDVRYWLASAKQGLGRVALARGQTAAASRWLREAIALHEESSTLPRAGRDFIVLAWSYLWLGRAELEAGRPGAVPAIRTKLDGVLSLLGDTLLLGATVPQQSAALAQLRVHADELTLLARAGTASEKIEAGRKELLAWRIRADKQRSNPDHRFEVAMGLVHLAELLEHDGQIAEARASLDEALPSIGALTKAEPGSRRWRHGLARASETLGRVQARAGRKTEASDAASRAVSLMEELARIDVAYSYDLACALGLRATISSSQADATAATAALRRAIEVGFDNAHLLRTDPRLKSLQSRPDFPVLNAVGS